MTIKSDEPAITDPEDRRLRLDWPRLLLVSGLVATIAVSAVAIYLTDIEGGVVALALAVSTGLFYFGKRIVGAIGLLLTAGVTTFFMTTAALVNMRGFAGLEGLLIAGGLAALSNLVVLASIGFLIRRDRPATIGPWLVVGYVAITLVQPFIGGELPLDAVPEPADLAVVAENLAFSESELTAPAGSLTVSLENRDLFWHTFTIDELGVELRVPVGAEMTVDFDAPPGEYTFFCSVPGHPEAGMVGTLVVEG